MKLFHVRIVGLLSLALLLLALDPTMAAAAPPVNGPVIHIVRWGENLTRISERYGVGVYEIAVANRLTDPNRIYVGQQLVIPLTPAPAPAPTGDTIQYTVQAGDTLSALAVRYHSTVNAIVQANGLVNPSCIYVGQVLYIPTQGSNLPGEGVYYTVRAGDTLAAIAYRYGVSYWPIVQANNLHNPAVIYVGQVLFIPGAADGGSPAPTPVPQSEQVNGWAGMIRGTEQGAQYDDYFENPNGVRYGIDGTDDTVRQKIAALRDTGKTVYIWGTLFQNVPDVNNVQIRATDVKEAGAVPTPTSSSAPGTPAPTPTWNPQSCTPPPLTTATPYPTCPAPGATPIPLGPVPLPSPFPPKPLHMDSPEYGMIVNVWGMGNCVTDRDLRLVKESGFTWVKQLFRWRDIEVQNDKFDWREADRVVAMVAKYELDLAIAVAYQPEWAGGGYPLNGPPRNMADFADFMGALAQRYRGLVRAYEIWPGPNVSENWGGQTPDPHRYAEMVIDGYWYVKNQDPYAMIITGGLVQTAMWDGAHTPPLEFFKVLYDETDAPKASDVWGVQALGFKAAPENTPEELANPDLNNSFPATKELNRVWGFRSIEVLHDYTTPPEKPIKKQWVVTRMGWTTDPRERSWVHWAAVSEEVKADYLRRAYRWAEEQWSDWIGVMFVPLTDARLTPADEGYYWAIVDPNGCPRKSYYVLKEIAK